MTLKRKYRILYIQKFQIGGTADALYDLVKNLDRSVYEPILVFYQSGYSEKFKSLEVEILTLSKSQPGLGDVITHKHATSHLTRYGKWFPHLYRAINVLILIFSILALIKKKSISIVHHNESLYQDRFTVIAACLAGVPQICHMHAFSSVSKLETFLSQFVSCFLYVSNAVRQHYESLGISAAKGHVVYNGFDLPSFDRVSTNDIHAVRTEFKVADQDTLISNVGRLDSWKGQDYFLQAIAQVIQRHSALKALVVGPSEDSPWNQVYNQKLKQLVIDLKLSNHVVFTGFRADVLSILAASQIVVHSSSQPEPFGRIIVEAMLTGTPVIATAAGGVLDIIDDKTTGLLIPLKNFDRMADSILYLIQHSKEADTIRLNARQKAKNFFSAQQCISRIQSCYQKILNPEN